MHRPRRHLNTIQSCAPDQVADQVTDGGVGLESGGLTEGSSYLVDGGVVDSLASKNILTTDELDVAAEREEPGLCTPGTAARTAAARGPVADRAPLWR